MVKTVYIADFSDISDFFDVAYLMLSDKHDVAIVAPVSAHIALTELMGLCDAPSTYLHDGISALVTEPATWIVTSDYDVILPLLNSEPDIRRNVIQRLFIVGGHANDYAGLDEAMRIDPRLKEREPDRFSPEGDFRVTNMNALLSALLCGEGVIWLPRDICLWRYAAPQIFDLAPNRVNTWLRTRLADARGEGAPVLLSTFPAFCLAVSPETMPWLRLFHTVLARIEASPLSGRPTPIITQTKPNAYVVSAIDGFACGKFITNVLRGPAQ